MKIKDKIKENKKIEKLKEYKESFDILWSNPKSHAIIMLSFWFVLVLGLSLLVRLSPSDSFDDVPIVSEDVVFLSTSDGIKEYLNSIGSYQASISAVGISDFDFEITAVNNVRLISYNGLNFYYDGNMYLLSNNDKVLTDDKNVLDINFFSVYNIYNLIKDINEEYITIYKDESYLVSYNILVSDFFLKYDGTIVDTTDTINVIISGINGINKIDVDLTNLGLSDFYQKLTINLSNVNNIEKINIVVED